MASQWLSVDCIIITGETRDCFSDSSFGSRLCCLLVAAHAKLARACFSGGWQALQLETNSFLMDPHRFSWFPDPPAGSQASPLRARFPLHSNPSSCRRPRSKPEPNNTPKPNAQMQTQSRNATNAHRVFTYELFGSKPSPVGLKFASQDGA